MSDNIYKIPCVNFFRLEAELKKLNNKAEKLGWQPVKLKILRTVTESRHAQSLDGDYDFSFHECMIEGGPPAVSSWSLVAVIEPLKDTEENMVREVPGQVCPAELRTTDLRCDHCLTTRKRSAIFILRHQDGRYAQVGRNCISNFLDDSAGLILSSAQLLDSLYDIVNRACSSEEKEWVVFDVNHFVSVVAMLIRKIGWVPKSHANDEHEATANIAFDICMGKDRSKLIKKHGLRLIEEDRLLAQAAIEWAAGIHDASTTYLHDLGVSCRSNYVWAKTAGYVASVIMSYKRHIADTGKSPRFANKSQHIGMIGERLELNDLQVIGKYPYVAAGFPKTTVKFIDAQGNILVWFASGDPEWIQVGGIVNVKATIVWHEDKDGVLTTKIKRVAQHGEDETRRSDEGSDSGQCRDSLPTSEATT